MLCDLIYHHFFITIYMIKLKGVYMGNETLLADKTNTLNRMTLLRIKELHKDMEYRYYIESFGCQMNSHDSERIAGMLEEAGYIKAAVKEEADIILFNTCCVREHAELRVFGNVGALRELKEKKPTLIIGVCGCMTQQEEVAKRLFKRFRFVDIVFGTHQLAQLPSMLESVLHGERVMNIDGAENVPEGIPIKRDGAFSTNVNIMFGCNNFCSYCIVPYVRGRERSRSHINIINEVEELANQGFIEITLLGQNVNSYRSPDSDVTFPQLLRMLNEINGIKRIRFMTSHPKDLSSELIDAMAECGKVCKHIHLPVQSGSNRILEKMNRRYTREKYLSLVEALRDRVKGVEISTDIIVGFPGETREDFEQTLSLVETVGFSTAYTFMYSTRKGTVAAKMDGMIDPAEKKRRLLELNELEAHILKKNNVKFIGSVGDVLVEGYDERDGDIWLRGKLSNFKAVYFKGSSDMVGRLIKVEIIDTTNNSLIGRVVQ